MSHGNGKSCLEMVELLSDYLDGELDASMRRLIEEHEGECPPCRSFIKTLARTVEVVRSQPRAPLPPRIREALAAALRKAAR